MQFDALQSVHVSLIEVLHEHDPLDHRHRLSKLRSPASRGFWDFANVPQSGNVSMSHSLKLCTVKELKTVYGIPYSRQHIWRLQDEGKFPLKVILGQCRVAFRCAEIEVWLADPLGWPKRATESASL